MFYAFIDYLFGDSGKKKEGFSFLLQRAVITTIYFIICTAFVTIPYIGVSPKWLSNIDGSSHKLMILPSITVALIGTS